jgi:hypothetical protein
MASTVRLLLIAGAVTAAALGGVPRAFACGSTGYSYAGLSAPEAAFGVSATVTSVEDWPMQHGHTAGWVGVGGPHQGPVGSNEWLQIGLSAFPDLVGNTLYYEVAQPSRFPVFHQIGGNVPTGEPVKVGVLEMHNRRNWWRVWLNGRAVSGPIRLPGSHDLWAPMAVAESWDGGTGGACNTFLYHFRSVEIAGAPGGGWHPLSGGFPITIGPVRLRSAHRSGNFLAAQGGAAFRLLPSLTP